ncbi:MAG: YkgJ family cysteine cluster protein [Methanoregula sp.]
MHIRLVITISLIPIPLRIAALTEERNRLFAYPVEQLAEIIRDVGFRCTGCAKCCTRTFNGHVFLLDRDVPVVREIDPSALQPAPAPEFCDQNGTFYVSSYALKAKADADGSCWFLENGRCRIYDRRFTICRIYPYMLHREPGEDGKTDWRQIAGLDKHGEYGSVIPASDCLDAARETKEYENAFLSQEIAFLECIEEHFSRHKLRHVQKVYDDRMRAFARGTPITVMVYFDGQLEKHRITP